MWYERVELMTRLTIEIPDNLARGLVGIAVAQGKSIEQLAVERLRSLVPTAGSPALVLQAVKEPPHLSSSVVDELEIAVRGRRAVFERGTGDRRRKT